MSKRVKAAAGDLAQGAAWVRACAARPSADRRRARGVIAWVLLALVWCAGWGSAVAQEGTVSIPLATWNGLASAAPDGQPRWSVAQAAITVTGGDERLEASASFRIQTFGDGVTLVPLLPHGVTAVRLRIDNADAAVVSTPAGLAWSAPRASTYQAQLVWEVEPVRDEGGVVAMIPLPQVPAATFTATIAGAGARVSAVPLRQARTTATSDGTRIEGQVPAASAVQLAWHRDDARSGGATRAVYRGALRGETVAWSAELTVNRAGEGRAVVPLVPSDVALVSVAVDGAQAPVLVTDGRFGVELAGRGTRRVVFEFETPVLRDRGAPRVDLVVPEVPMSRFELVLPGEKQVQSSPAAGVVTEAVAAGTRAVLHVAMTPRLTLTWSEAIPEAVEVEVRANANVIHLAHAEERLLTVRALATWEIQRGETNAVELLAPEGIQFNTIASSLGTVADWRIAADAPRRLVVFFDRPMSGEVPLEITYERTIGGPATEEVFAVPLLEPVGTSRQRGLLALLSSDEVALTPQDDGGATRVGENQLPPSVRDGITMTVAHTFRYNEEVPAVQVRATQPERQAARWDASVDTLVSLGDVTTRVAASVEVVVKQGRVMELELHLPADVNLLSLTAPSLRSQTVRTEGGVQVVTVAFTRELEGRFRIEASWEKIQADGTGAFEVPRLRVPGAEVEQGRLAVEALSAVEVQPGATEHLSTLDLAELPQHLVLRTTNPILLAFKYVQADPAPRLTLQVTRHAELAVQAATIDDAHYRSLVTADGFVVTSVRWEVRNLRRQFLRVALPAGSQVWSASVDGRPETPAMAADGEAGGAPEVLIRIRSGETPFAVELVYQTPIPRLGRFGRMRAVLPRPDMIVTRTVWDVWLPQEVAWGEPEGEMTWVNLGVEGAREAALAPPSGLGFEVPEQGVRLRFEKLYANQVEGEVGFAVAYTSTGGETLRSSLAWGAGLALWVGLLLAFVWGRRGPGVLLMGVGVGAAGLLMAWGGAGASSLAPALAWPALPAGAIVLGRWAAGIWEVRAERAALRNTGIDAKSGEEAETSDGSDSSNA